MNPKYLDSKGLVACWREGLLAQKVLMGETKGYKNHPQLNRFKNFDKPVYVLGLYLLYIYIESQLRGYSFDGTKINIPSFLPENHVPLLNVTKGQMRYEFKHLQTKLQQRDVIKWNKNGKACYLNDIEPHPLFKVVEGGIELWEKV
jgi:hypothetical protein